MGLIIAGLGMTYFKPVSLGGTMPDITPTPVPTAVAVPTPLESSIETVSPSGAPLSTRAPEDEDSIRE